jgi:uncharacterized protein YbaP (TraB family)
MKYLMPFLLLLLVKNTRAQAPVEKALLWEIVHPTSMAPTSYLYGTFHLLCPKDLVVDSAIKKAFARTRQLYLEIDMSDNAALMMQMMPLMKMKDDQRLDKLLNKVDYDSVAALFKAKTGLPLTMLNTTKPMLASAMLYPAMMGCQPESWEQTFLKMSEGRGMKIGGLETAALQMSVLDSISYPEQAESLKTMLYRFDSMSVVTQHAVDLYKHKELNKLYTEMAADKDMAKYEDIMLNNRNANWIPVMLQVMKKTPTFFAVGAGHLGGKKGVISLLRKKGYIVRPYRM